MYDALKKHALSNVWCSAEMDQQAVIVPARICRTKGVTGTVKVMLDTLKLPTPNDEYHVYQIGQMPTPVFSMDLTITDEWQLLEDICNLDVLQINLYTNDGIEYPKSLAYTMLTSANNMIIAVRNYSKLTNIRQEKLYLRFYSNAFKASTRADDIPVFMHTEGKVVGGFEDTAAIVNVYNQYKDSRGCVRTYWNGYLTDLPSVGAVQRDDTLEVVYDAGVETILEFPVKDLETFTSKLDVGVGKFLIHPLKDDLTIDSIFYRDDIDVYLMAEVDGLYKGVYLHHNQEHTIRMVTHNDYSVTVKAVEDHAAALGVTPDECKLRFYFRNSGYERPTVHETNYIHELYKLTDDEIVTAMTNTLGATTSWYAENLENSMYTAIMRADGASIDGEMALNAFGYKASTEYLMDSPLRVRQGESKNTPAGYLTSILRIKQAYSSDLFEVEYLNTTAMTVNQDMYSGSIGYRLSSIESRNNVFEDEKYVRIPTYKGVQCYRATKRAGLRVDDWIDVTDTANYTINDDLLTWQIDSNLYFTAVVCGDFSAMQKFTIDTAVNKLIPLMDVVSMDGVDVPCAEEMVFFNNYLMIRDIDYIKGENGYMVTNKALVNTEGPIEITIVKSGMESNAPKEEFGFVQYGTLSYNGRYDIHSGLLLQGTMGGKMLAKEDLRFYEGPKGDMYGADGSPYLLQYSRGPILDIPWEDAKARRDDSDEKLEVISNYLHERIPEIRPEYPVTIPGKYQTYSPFIDAIVEAFGNGSLTIPEGRITNDQMEVIIRPYLPLLEFEPSKTERFHDGFMIVHPTNNDNAVIVTPIQYAALQQIINHWLDGIVILTDIVGVN